MQLLPSIASLFLLLACATAPVPKKTEPNDSRLSASAEPARDSRFVHGSEPAHESSVVYDWVDVVLETSARDVVRIGARPTILSRQMVIPITAMYDAWSAYDDKALPVYLGDDLRRPEAERTASNREKAIAFAAFRALLYVFPDDHAFLGEQLAARGLDASSVTLDPSTPEGLGNLAAAKVIAARQNDGANQDGKRSEGAPMPYGDYTGYAPVNGDGEVKDPDRWGALPFITAKGEIKYVGFLTPHWYKVRPFALKSADQFRPGPPPKVGDPQLKAEVEEIVRLNANLTPADKAVVEFMRDGPASTGQSGHWLRFAQDVSRRDKHDLDQDMKLFFAVANVAFDAFIASWESKRHYDSSRPWHLVRHYYKGQTLRGWKGPGKGVGVIKASDWLPYSPLAFLSPPFPGYVSGHSTVSSAGARILELFTGSDHFGFKETRTAGAITEEAFSCADIQKQYDLETSGDTATDCKVTLDLPTFSATAEIAGISRVKGAYHIQADNIAGLELGRSVADWSWPIYQAYFNGDSEGIKLRDP